MALPPTPRLAHLAAATSEPVAHWLNKLGAETVDLGAGVQTVSEALTTLDTAVDALALTTSGHIAATEAHGASGDIIGTGNAAAAGTRGAVFQGAAVADPASTSLASTVAVASPDAAAQTGGYVQADVQSIATLANELKADLAQLVTDLNAVRTDMLATRTALVALITSLEAAGVVAT